MAISSPTSVILVIKSLGHFLLIVDFACAFHNLDELIMALHKGAGLMSQASLDLPEPPEVLILTIILKQL